MLMLFLLQAVKHKNSQKVTRKAKMLEKETLKESLATPRGWVITTIASAMMLGNVLSIVS